MFTDFQRVNWSMLGYAGETSAKESFLANLKSGKSKIECFAIGPMDVTLLGNVAVVQGTTTERSSADGADSSSKFIWMDVFAKCGDKWVVVRSQFGKRWVSSREPALRCLEGLPAMQPRRFLTQVVSDDRAEIRLRNPISRALATVEGHPSLWRAGKRDAHRCA
jgi:hypothetical protein